MIKNANWKFQTFCGDCVIARDKFSEKRIVVKVSNRDIQWRMYGERGRIEFEGNAIRCITQSANIVVLDGDFIILDKQHESELIAIRKLNGECDEKR